MARRQLLMNLQKWVGIIGPRITGYTNMNDCKIGHLSWKMHGTAMGEKYQTVMQVVFHSVVCDKNDNVLHCEHKFQRSIRPFKPPSPKYKQKDNHCKCESCTKRNDKISLNALQLIGDTYATAAPPKQITSGGDPGAAKLPPRHQWFSSISYLRA